MLERQQKEELLRRHPHLKVRKKRKQKVLHGQKECQRTRSETLGHSVTLLQRGSEDLHILHPLDASQAGSREADLQTVDGGNE